MLNKIADIAWFAGIIDGEGCIRINKVKTRAVNGKCYFAYRPFLSITNTDKAIIERLNKLWKGTSRIIENKSKIAHWRPHYRIVWSDKRCLGILLKTRDYLTGTKQQQADLVIEFYRDIKAQTSNRAFFYKISDEEHTRRQQIIAKLALLKRGVVEQSTIDNTVNSGDILRDNPEPSPVLREGATTRDGASFGEDGIVWPATKVAVNIANEQKHGHLMGVTG